MIGYDIGEEGLPVNDELVSDYSLILSLAEGPDAEDIGNTLISAYGIAMGIKSQHVTIYTTWDDDRSSATTVVPLTTVVPED